MAFKITQNSKRLLLLLFLVFSMNGCFKSCSSTEPVVEKPQSLLEWALIRDKRSIVYGVKDVFINEKDSTESTWKEGQVRFQYLKDSVAGVVSFLQYQVEALDKEGNFFGETDTFWLWQDPVQKQKIHIKGQGIPSMPRFLALKRSDVAELEEVSAQEEQVNTFNFPFFSVFPSFLPDTVTVGSFKEVNSTLLKDSLYSWNGKQYKVWQVERNLLYQNRNLSKVKLLYGAEGLMYSEQVWNPIRSRNSEGKLLLSGALKRQYRLQYIGD